MPVNSHSSFFNIQHPLECVPVMCLNRPFPWYALLRIFSFSCVNMKFCIMREFSVTELLVCNYIESHMTHANTGKNVAEEKKTWHKFGQLFFKKSILRGALGKGEVFLWKNKTQVSSSPCFVIQALSSDCHVSYVISTWHMTYHESTI